jgi:hypothetical protein
MGAYLTLQSAPDWDGVRGGHPWFIDYYLAQMSAAGTRQGRRLLDVLDVHWYPEARGDSRVTDRGATSTRDVEARLQAPRTLWDPTYRENSWIAEWFFGYLPILPRLRQSIEQHYPGTKLGVTEYNFGGGSTVSGGLAQADVLGVFGREGVYLATLWGIEEDEAYLASGFKLYRDYDGRGGVFGNIAVRAAVSDRARASVYASVRDGDAALHVVLINKHREGPLEFRFAVTSPARYRSAGVWGFGPGSAVITERRGVDRIDDNAFTYVVPEETAVHMVLR